MASTLAAPTQQPASPLTAEAKAKRDNARIGELRKVRYDPIGKPVKGLSADEKAKRVNARLAEMARG